MRQARLFSTIVSLVAALMIFVGTPGMLLAETGGSLYSENGDMNGDGAFNSDDAVYLLFNIVNNIDNDPELLYYVAPYEGKIQHMRDFDGDGSINSGDAVYLLNSAVNGTKLFPFGGKKEDKDIHFPPVPFG